MRFALLEFWSMRTEDLHGPCCVEPRRCPGTARFSPSSAKQTADLLHMGPLVDETGRLGTGTYPSHGKIFCRGIV
jgi:hypothetical protein